MTENADIAVVATEVGYYGSKIRHPGEEFRIDSEEAFSSEWMKKLVEEEKPAPKSKGKAKAKPEPEPEPEPVVDEAEADAAAKIQMAKELTGREDIETVEQAEEILIAAGEL